MRKLSDKTQRILYLSVEPQEINKMIYQHLKENDIHFEEKEVELKYDFIEEGSPAYKTGKIRCSIKIIKDVA